MNGLPEDLYEKFRPIYKINIKNPDDGKEYEFNSWFYTVGTKRHRSINKLTIYVDRDMEKSLDMFRIRIATKSGSLRSDDADLLAAGSIKLGATVKIYLGYDNGSESSFKLWSRHLVFTGLVEQVSQDLKNIVITGYSNAYKIIFRKPVGKAFDEKTPQVKTSQNLVQVLLKGTGVLPDTGKYFATGMTFPTYTPDTDKTIYENIKGLADLNGYDLYFSRDGKLRFCESDNASPKDLEYAIDIIDTTTEMTRPPYDKITVQVCHEHAKNGGEMAWTFSADPVAGSSGIGKNKVEKVEKLSGIIKSMDDAEKVAKARMDGLYKPKSGQVTILGTPDVELCQSINLKFAKAVGKSAPGAEELDNMKQANAHITRITHKFNMKSGFVTVISWAGSAKLELGHTLLPKDV